VIFHVFYCGVGIPAGGGSYSERSPTKVDRSGVYMVRYFAKNSGSANLAEKYLVRISYIIGKKKPIILTYL